MVIILLESVHVFTCWNVHLISLMARCRSSSIKICVSRIVVYNTYLWCRSLFLHISSNAFAYLFVLRLGHRVISFWFWIIQLLYWHVLRHILNILCFRRSSMFLNWSCTCGPFVLILTVHFSNIFNSP